MEGNKKTYQYEEFFDMKKEQGYISAVSISDNYIVIIIRILGTSKGFSYVLSKNAKVIYQSLLHDKEITKIQCQSPAFYLSSGLDNKLCINAINKLESQDRIFEMIDGI